MSHFVTLHDAARNNRLEDMGQFIEERLPGHVCIPECHEIGREPVNRETYGSAELLRCAFCETFQASSMDDAIEHTAANHPIILRDITTMVAMGYTEPEIDEISTSEEYMPMKVTFIHEHDTQRKSRYSELMPGDVTRTLYLATEALRQEFGTVPKRIIITIERDGE